MDEEDRKLVFEIMSKMIDQAQILFDEKRLEHYVKFKIVAREIRLGDYSLGEEITMDQIKEWKELKKE